MAPTTLQKRQLRICFNTVRFGFQSGLIGREGLINFSGLGQTHGLLEKFLVGIHGGIQVALLLQYVLLPVGQLCRILVDHVFVVPPRPALRIRVVDLAVERVLLACGRFGHVTVVLQSDVGCETFPRQSLDQAVVNLVGGEEGSRLILPHRALVARLPSVVYAIVLPVAPEVILFEPDRGVLILVHEFFHKPAGHPSFEHLVRVDPDDPIRVPFLRHLQNKVLVPSLVVSLGAGHVHDLRIRFVHL